MGLDIYVGSMTRYYTGEWETIVQRTAREQGLKFEVIRPTDTAADDGDRITDPDELRPIIEGWRQHLSASLGSHIESPLDWDESNGSPYFTDKPTWHSYSSLMLWAAYNEHPDLPRPSQGVADWSEDPAFTRSADPDFASRHPQLLRDVECWLPHNFDFTFGAVEPNERELVFGSSIALCRDLDELNHRTWNASDGLISQWRRAGAEPDAPLETGARFAFAVMLQLAREAVAHRLIMRLDY